MNPKASILQLGSCSRRQCCQHFNLLRSIINSKDLNYHRHVIIDTHQLIESQQFVLFIRLYFLAFQLDNTPYKDSVNHVLRHAISQRRVLLTVFGPKVSPAQKSVGAPRGALVMVYTRPWESRGGQADAYTMLIAQDGRHKKYSPKVRDSSRMLNKMYIHKNDIFMISQL